MDTIALRHIDRCTLNPSGLVRIERLGTEIFVLGHGYCLYAPNEEESERIFKLVRESIRDGVDISTLNCDRCNLDLLEDQTTVMLGEDICCPRCGVLNPSEVLHEGDAGKEEKSQNLYECMKALIRYCQAELRVRDGDMAHEDLYGMVAEDFTLYGERGARPIWLSRVITGIIDDYGDDMRDVI